jgi:acetyl esterase
MFSAEDYIPICARIAVETGCTVVNVDYDLAPEHKAPRQVDQGLEALKWVKENLKPKNICLSGESAGGYICTSVAMQDPEVQLLIPVMPMTGNEYLKKKPEEFDEFRRKFIEFLKNTYNMMVEDPAKHEDDPMIFCNLMSDEIAQKMPRTIVFSSEWDFYLDASRDLAKKLNAEICVHPGAQHLFFMNFDAKITDIFFADYAKAVKTMIA